MSRRVSRGAWLVAGSLVTVATLVFGTANIVGAIARETEAVRRVYERVGSLDRVVVRVDHGSVEVAGSLTDRVEITGTVSHGLQRTSLRDTIADGELSLASGCPDMWVWCRVDLTVAVPSSVSVDVALSSGTVRVSGVDGGVRSRGRNGAVELSGVAGDVDVETRNGAITATSLSSAVVRADTRNGAIRFGFAQDPRLVTARSVNGPVHIAVPSSGTGYRVHLDTRNGKTATAVLTDPSSPRSIVATTRNGDVTIRYAGPPASERSG